MNIWLIAARCGEKEPSVTPVKQQTPPARLATLASPGL